jgi:iron complex outermembrane receptor protein
MRQLYDQAASDYQIGRIEQARDALLQHLDNLHGNLRQNALHLIALSYLARFDMEETERYATLMLHENPYYSPPANDPATFVDIVNSIKAGMTATITTASSQAESLAEVPVPATLITPEMIQNSGARNLQEVLAAFVPGMNIIDCNDDINIAMRGIYSNTQEKILIMLNGHRLNSYATNTAAPDFSISLEKVKQIEVLRGPASSLYGGVALTAVVNIITKQGGDVDGIELKAGAGNYGQIRADLLFGKRYFDVDMLVWGSVYRSSGEKYDVTNERAGESLFQMPVSDIRIGRIGDRPTYDFGVQLGYKEFQFMYDTHLSQVVAPFTLASLARSYDYDRYRTFNGMGPCFGVYSHHADLSYSRQLGNLSLKAVATYDKSDMTRYQVINDDPMPTLSIALSLPSEMLEVFSTNGGLFRYVDGQEQDYGFQLKGNYAYTLGSHHKGNIGFGVEYDHFQLDDLRYQIGYNFEETFAESPLMHNTGKGKENSVDAYLQLKHQWRSLILNAGMRYDYKNRYDDTKVREFSPRVALILLRPKWNVKLSYSKSFVDAPYIYRKANVMSELMRGADGSSAISLSPERVHSFQLSFAGTNWVKGLDFEVNGFYNRANDLILTSILDYSNASQNKTCGAELMASYHSPLTVSDGSTIGVPRFSAYWNFTWTHTFKSNVLDLGVPERLVSPDIYDINTNNNTPAFMSNLVLGWQATRRLKLHTHLRFESRQTSYNSDLEKYVLGYVSYFYYLGYIITDDKQKADAALQDALDYASKITMHKEIPARAIVNLGGEYTLGPVTLGLNIHNLLGTRYYRSGMNTNVIPQQGRWFLFSVGVKL